jgi:hypothetical protein
MHRLPEIHHPHLRLTAALVVASFVAILAALGGADSSDNTGSRTRRLDANTMASQGMQRTLLALGVVTSEVGSIDYTHLGAILGHGTARAAEMPEPHATSARAIDRATRRIRLDAANPARAALLRTTVLPPPIA